MRAGEDQVSKGRLKRRALPQPSLRDWTAISLVVPNVERLGYCRASLRDEEQILAALELQLCAAQLFQHRAELELCAPQSLRFLNSEPFLPPSCLTLATSRRQDRPVRSFRFARESAGVLDDRCSPSSGAPGDFFPRSIPNPASRSARFSENELVDRAGPASVGDRATRRGLACFCVPGSPPLAQAAAMTLLLESSPLAPSIRVHARCADGAIVGLDPPHRSTAADLPNPHPACQWDKLPSEIRTQPMYGLVNRRM